jgi:hypothetical protein
LDWRLWGFGITGYRWIEADFFQGSDLNLSNIDGDVSPELEICSLTGVSHDTGN